MTTTTIRPQSIVSRTGKYLPIEDYGLIGDLRTVALVGKNGSIDWCCLPVFDSPSVFGAILDAEKGGFFRLAPIGLSHLEYKQHYIPLTNILVTRFLAPEGVGEVIDFMPVQPQKKPTTRNVIVRYISVVRGALTFEVVCRPAFNYARDPHTIHISSNGVIFRSPVLSLSFASTPLLAYTEDGRGGMRATIHLQEGERAYFVLESMKPSEELKTPQYALDEMCQDLYQENKRFWRSWISQSRYQGRWREMVERSALVLKLLTYQPTGAVIAAPTTSLPEGIGGERNWDYRFTWLRDASLTLNSLLQLGLTEEADAFGNWVRARVHELPDAQSLQPLFTIHGDWEIPEEHLDHLEGYQQSRPVRIGNGAYKQKQLDVYGELLDSMSIFLAERGIYYEEWVQLHRMLQWLSTHWQELDEGIWEVRGGPKAFVHSRLMCWVAFDRALQLAEHQRLPAPREEWQKVRDTIYQEIMDKGWSEEKQSFVQYYGCDAVDATALQISLTKFTAQTDPRLLKTIDRIQKELMHKPHINRYKVGTAANDGLQGQEGAFNLCSFWLVEALTHAGRLEEARSNLELLFTYASHLGLYAEEIGPSGEALGNFPQAFTHLALIRACISLDQALNEKSHLMD